MSKKIIYIFIVAAVTAIAFYPSLLNDFVDLDDPRYVFNNGLIKSISWQNINRIFTSGFAGSYCPIPILTYAIEYHFLNLNPFIYHLVNYLLHLLTTLSVFCFIYIISGSLIPAFISSLLFGIHPMHVESVAWISERKDLLCAVFYLACLIAYVKYLEHKKVSYYLICFISAFLALGSKSMAITIPFVFFLVDYLHGRKIDGAMMAEKIPFFILSAVFGAIGFYFQSIIGALNLKATLIVKAYFLLKAIPFYLYKLAVPTNLSAMYLYHDLSPRHISEIKYFIAALILLAGIVIFSGRYSRKILFGSLFFIITLLPVLKIIPLGDSFAADRYMYLPSIGIFYIISLGLEKIFRVKNAKGIKISSGIIVVAAVVLYSILTWQRCGVWKDTESLYNDILEKYPKTAALYNDLGAFFAYKGDYDKAIKCFNVALMLKPDYEEAKRNLGIVRLQLFVLQKKQ